MTSLGTVVIVTHYFAPRNEIAAVRLTNLALGLESQGWSVRVVTMGINEHNPLELGPEDTLAAGQVGYLPVVTARAPWLARRLYALRAAVGRGRSGPRSWTAAAPTGSSTGRSEVARVIRRLTGAINLLLRRAVGERQAAALVRATLVGPIPDAVFVSFGPSYMIRVGTRLADVWPGAAVVMDLRDPIVRGWGGETSQVREGQLRIQRRMLRKVAGVTVVSEGMVEGPGLEHAQIEVVPNGFEKWRDPIDKSFSRAADDVLTLYYGGRLYPTQSLDALVSACAELARSRRVEVHYAGLHSRDFIEAFDVYGASDLVVSHGLVSREESLALQDAADVNILLSWNHLERGVMTGKVYELIAGRRPIVCLVAGDHEGSALADLFRGDQRRRVFSPEISPENVDAIIDFLDWCGSLPDDVADRDHDEVRYGHLTVDNLAMKLSRYLSRLTAEKQASRRR